MMKQKLYVCLFGLVMMTASCTVDDVNITSSIQMERVASLEEQSAAVRNSLGELEKVDEALRAEMDSLWGVSEDLQAEVERLSAVELQDSMLIVSLRESIAELDSLIPPMMREDSLLTEKMEELESYAVYLTDSVSSDTESWIFNTFATLEKFDSLCVEVVGIDTSVRLVNWVNGNMTGCRTLAGIKGRIQRLKGKIQGGNKELVSYETALAPIKRDMLEAYKSVIRTSIETMDGKLDDGLKGEISSANSAMVEDLAAIVEKVEEMEARVEKAESDVEEILSWVRSVSVVPDTEDGSVAVQEDEGDFEVCLAVYPLAVADSIAKRGTSYISFEVVETETKASSIFTSLTVKSVKYEKELLKLTVSTSGLPSGVLSGEKRPFARVVFSSGKYLKGSDFFPLSYVRKVSIDLGDVIPIWKDETLVIKPTVTPANYPATFSFESSDPSIAIVNDDGVLIARKLGIITLKVHLRGSEDICDSCRVDVIPREALKGRFSIEDGKYGYFSRGILRAVRNKSYQEEKDQWEHSEFLFAHNETDLLGNKNIVDSHLADTVDLFGWSSVNCYEKGVPWGISTDAIYQHYDGDFRDWGTKIGKGWKTLSYSEWDYLINSRPQYSALRKTSVTVGSFSNSAVLAPDDYSGTLKSTYVQGEAEREGVVCIIKGYRRFENKIYFDSLSGVATADLAPEEGRDWGVCYKLTFENRPHYDAYMVRLIFIPDDL